MVHIQIRIDSVDRRGANMDVHGHALVSGSEYDTEFSWTAEDLAMNSTAAQIIAASRQAAIDAAAALDPSQVVGATDKKTMYGIPVDLAL